MLLGVEACTVYGDKTVLEINVGSFKAQELLAAVAAEDCQSEESKVF